MSDLPPYGQHPASYRQPIPEPRATLPTTPPPVPVNDAVILPFPRKMTDEEWLALSILFAYAERADAPENVQAAARVMREVLR